MTKLKEAIDASGLKQIYIAKKIGIDVTMLSKYVCGDREPPDETIKQIARILRVPQWQLR